MTVFGPDSLATLEFVLHWRDQRETHEERFLARRVNAWRDIFPPRLLSSLHGAKSGDKVSLDYSPGEILEQIDPRKILTLPKTAFKCPCSGGRQIPVTPGRFYPQGLLQGLPSVYPQNAVPFRLLEMADEYLMIDTNHPLAGIPLQLEVSVEWIQTKQSDTGGTLSHWMEEVCNYGPGMQSLPKDGQLTIPPAFFERDDDVDDSVFYSVPRMISHVDEQADHNLKAIYRRFLKPGMRVLDLMSSVDSHLPMALDITVTGLGMSDTEMEKNGRLAHWIVHDLNHTPTLPSELSGPFDAVLCSLSIEYLTRPVDVLRSVLDSLAPGGVIAVGFSDRWFPGKAIAGWVDLHPFERSGHVLHWLRKAGFAGKAGTVSIRNDWRPQEDPHFIETRGVSDPVFVVWAYKD